MLIFGQKNDNNSKKDFFKISSICGSDENSKY